MPAVQSEFLPPDPHADAPSSSQPVFLPPSAGQPASPQRQDSRAVWALIFGSGSLGLLVFSAGLLFFVTLPASIAGWVLGAKAKRMAEGRRDQANVAVIVAIVGCVLSVIAAAIWIALFATGQYSTSTQVDHGGDRGVHFDVIRLLVTGA